MHISGHQVDQKLKRNICAQTIICTDNLSNSNIWHFLRLFLAWGPQDTK